MCSVYHNIAILSDWIGSVIVVCVDFSKIIPVLSMISERDIGATFIKYVYVVLLYLL